MNTFFNLSLFIAVNISSTDAGAGSDPGPHAAPCVIMRQESGEITVHCMQQHINQAQTPHLSVSKREST